MSAVSVIINKGTAETISNRGSRKTSPCEELVYKFSGEVDRKKRLLREDNYLLRGAETKEYISSEGRHRSALPFGIPTLGFMIVTITPVFVVIQDWLCSWRWFGEWRQLYLARARRA
jgi:hypothetical protein